MSIHELKVNEGKSEIMNDGSSFLATGCQGGGCDQGGWGLSLDQEVGSRVDGVSREEAEET